MSREHLPLFTTQQELSCCVVKVLTFSRYRVEKQLEVTCLISFKKERKSEKGPLCFAGLQPEVSFLSSPSKFAAQGNKTCAAGC